MAIKNKVPVKIRKWQSLLLFRIEKHNIELFSNDELKTWDTKKLKEISSKINLYISKQTFKRRLKASKNVGLSDKIVEKIEGSENQNIFNKLINDLPDEARSLLGYFKKMPIKEIIKIGNESSKMKSKSKEPKSVKLIYTPMGNKR